MSVLFALMVFLGDYTALRFGLAVLAMAVERVAVFPAALLRLAGRPAAWIASFMGMFERSAHHEAGSTRSRRAWGGAALLVVLLGSGGAAWMVQELAGFGPVGLVTLAILASPLLSQRRLGRDAAAVATELEGGRLAAGGGAVARPAGRDAAPLDEPAVARAAIESLATGLSAGVVAPAFWLAAAGLPGGVACKAAGIAGGMSGNASLRDRDFAWAAARLGALVNLPASRLAALLLVAAACLVRGASPRGAGRSVWRDAGRHRSPNAGWPQAAMAGALGLALGGPRIEAGIRVEDAVMGDGGRREATSADIRRALRLYWTADALLFGMLAMMAGLLFLV